MDLRSKPNLWFRYLLTTLSPKCVIRVLFRLCHHKWPDLKNPKTLDEKIQWMKLNYYKDNDLVKQCADKYRVREYVQEAGFGHILNDIVTSYHSASEINWDELPERFVLKWNFGNGGNVVCTDKSKLDKEKAVRELNAVKEAARLEIPIVAITDTNADPDPIDYVIPGNDDAIRAIKLFVNAMAEACLEGAAQTKEVADPEAAMQQAAEAAEAAE